MVAASWSEGHATARSTPGVPLIPRRSLQQGAGGAGEFARVSPDGTHLLFVAPLAGVPNIWVTPIERPKSARPITRERRRGPIGPPQWANDSRHILFTKDRDGDGDYKVYSIDIASGRSIDLASARGKESSFILYDDGISLPARSAEQVGFALLMSDSRKPGTFDLYRVDVATAKRSLVARNDEGFSAFFLDSEGRVRAAERIKSDNHTILYARAGDRWKEIRSWGEEDGAGSGLTSVLGVEGGNKSLLMLSSVGRDFPALERIDLSSGEHSTIVSDPKASIADVWVEPRSGQLQAYSREYLKREEVALEASVRSDIALLSRALDDGFQVTSRSRDDRFWTIESRDPANGGADYLYDRKQRKLTRLFSAWPSLENEPLRPLLPLELRARDGLILTAYLTLPAGVTLDSNGHSNKAVPLVLNVHGGPSDRDSYMFRVDHQWLANRGYAVLSVNFRGSHQLGKRLHNASAGELGMKMQDDLVDAVSWAVANGIALKDRIAIYGLSYGGYAVLRALTATPDLFACGVDNFGPSDIELVLKDAAQKGDTLTLGTFETLAGATLATAKGVDHIRDISPVNHADRLTKPILIVQGGNDPAVRREHSDRMVEALTSLGKPVTYIFYPDEGHGILRSANALSVQAITEAFLARCLGGRLEPLHASDFEGSSVEVRAGAAQWPELRRMIEVGEERRSLAHQ
jgi:dipeptidyl aminopeptidase/acylaminoacyl peptidase